MIGGGSRQERSQDGSSVEVHAGVSGGSGASASRAGRLGRGERAQARSGSGDVAEVGAPVGGRRGGGGRRDARGARGDRQVEARAAPGRGGEADSPEGGRVFRQGDRSPVRCYRLVDQERAHHAVSLLCSVLGVSRQAYYAWRGRAPSARELRDRELKELIGEVFAESRRTYGAPRVAKTLRRKRGQPVATKRVARLMGELGLRGLSRGRKGHGTTVQDPAATSAPDLLKRNFSADAPDRIWVADITYIRCYEGWLYLAIVMDLFSRKIIGWSMRVTLEAEIVSDALAMAVARRRPAAGVIHHSDRGSQYTSILMGKTLRKLDVVPSMGSRGCAYDNAACESAIGTIKLELVEQHVFATRDIARLRVFDYIEAFYNPLRMHTTLGDLSPNEYEAAYHATLTEDRVAA